MKKFLTSIIMLYATAIDGDSFMYNNKEVRLHGIDAPEYHQKCFDADGKEYHCGDKAYQHLKKLLKNPVDCMVVTKDKYGRDIAICGDINKQMVLSGWAVSYYADDYKKNEEVAKGSKKGMWQGKFLRPEYYRALNRDK